MSQLTEIERLFEVRRGLRALGYAQRRLEAAGHPLASSIGAVGLYEANRELIRQLAALRKRLEITAPEMEKLERARRDERWQERLRELEQRP